MPEEKGPVYGVPLIGILHLGRGCMDQAMPSRSDLKGIKDFRQGQRVVAGYEVLLNEWRQQAGIIHALADQLARYTGHTIPIEIAKAATRVDENDES